MKIANVFSVFSWLGLLLIVMLIYFFSAQAVASVSDAVILLEDQKMTSQASISSLKPKELSLLNWRDTEKPRPKPADDYDRPKHFGRWVQFKNTRGCYNVRAQVLIRDSRVRPSSIDQEPCTIEKGEWNDPYSGQKFENDDEVQIDHMVPLKEAYEAGAFAWTPARRCVYANFMGMKEHLIATSNFENQSKSDKTPEFYMPPRREYQCTYLKNWLAVKFIWKLSMTSGEASAIKAHMKEAGCKISEFSIDQKTVAEMRRLAVRLEKTCPVAHVKESPAR